MEWQPNLVTIVLINIFTTVLTIAVVLTVIMRRFVSEPKVTDTKTVELETSPVTLGTADTSPELAKHATEIENKIWEIKGDPFYKTVSNEIPNPIRLVEAFELEKARRHHSAKLNASYRRLLIVEFQSGPSAFAIKPHDVVEISGVGLQELLSVDDNYFVNDRYNPTITVAGVNGFAVEFNGELKPWSILMSRETFKDGVRDLETYRLEVFLDNPRMVQAYWQKIDYAEWSRLAYYLNLENYKPNITTNLAYLIQRTIDAYGEPTNVNSNSK